MGLGGGCPATGATRRALGPWTRQIGKAILFPSVTFRWGTRRPTNSAIQSFVLSFNQIIPPTKWPKLDRIARCGLEYQRGRKPTSFQAQRLGVLHAVEVPSFWGRSRQAWWTWRRSCTAPFSPPTSLPLLQYMLSLYRPTWRIPQPNRQHSWKQL